MVIVPPRIVPFCFEEPIFAGQAAQVTCLVSEGDSPLNISWSFSGSLLKSLAELGISTSMIGQKANVLLIETASAQHRGNYTCSVISLPSSTVTRYTAELNINGKVFMNLDDL